MSAVRLVGPLLLLVALGSARPAIAQDTEPTADDLRAREIYRNGATLYSEGNYEEAIVAFEEAYRLSGRHELLINVANAQERLGEIEAAIEALNRYRIFAHPDERASLARRVESLQARLAAPPELEPEPAPDPVSPPVVATPILAPGPSLRDRRRRAVAGWALFGTGMVAAGGFGAVAGLSYADSRTWLANGDRASWEQGRPLNNASVALAVTGGVLATTGLIVAASRAPRMASWSVSPAPGGLSAAASWRFR